MNELAHLMSPIKIKSLELANRVVIPSMGTGLANADGSLSKANLAYFSRRVQSGAGLIISEIVSVHPHGTAGPGSLKIYDESYVPDIQKLADIAHAHGCKAALQLHHAGRESLYQLKLGQAVAPSAIPSFIYGLPPKEMTLDDIGETIITFGTAALRAKQAGFDAVEIHGAHGYLLNQFLSANSNRRQDDYGGDLSKRARFVIEVVEEVRRRVGDDFPVFLRISAQEFIKGGYTVEEMQGIVPLFVQAGANLIDVSFGTHGSPGGITSAPIEYEPGFNIHLARKIKEVVDVPVITVGRFTSPFLADKVIAQGDADMVAFGRQTLADPNFLINTLEGHPEDTIECIACNQGCIERLILEHRSLRCAINPETGQELKYPNVPVKTGRRVWVVGAGPGGLTSACEAARLGHQVTLFEANSQTGGQVRLAAQAPFKSAYEKWIDRLTARVQKLGVEIHTGTFLNVEQMREGRPDYVIVATGGDALIPEIEGVELPHVQSVREILSNDVPLADSILIIGAGFTGLEAADFAIAKGCKDIILVEAQSRYPVQNISSHGYMLHKRLKEAGVKQLLGTKVIKIEPGRVIISANDQETILEPINQVLLAVGIKPRNNMAEALHQEGIPYQFIGDAVKPARIIEAVESGAQAAWNIS